MPKTLSVVIPDDLDLKLRGRAKTEGLNLSDAIREGIEMYLALDSEQNFEDKRRKNFKLP